MIQRTAPVKFEMKSDTNNIYSRAGFYVCKIVIFVLRAGILNVDVLVKL